MLKSKFQIAAAALLLSASVSMSAYAAETKVQSQADLEFQGSVIGLIACNNNQSVVLTLHDAKTDVLKTFVTDAAPQGVLNPVLARAYISVGKKDGKPLAVTYNPEYTGESCGQDVDGYWTGYAK